MKQLSGGRLVVTRADSPEDIAAFFAALRAHRSSAAAATAPAAFGETKATGGN